MPSSLDRTLGRLLEGRAYEIDVERLLFALVANRALDPRSKLAVERWVGRRVRIDGLVHRNRSSMTYCHVPRSAAGRLATSEQAIQAGSCELPLEGLCHGLVVVLEAKDPIGEVREGSEVVGTQRLSL